MNDDRFLRKVALPEGGEMEIKLKKANFTVDAVCFKCLRVFTITPYALYLQEKDGHEALAQVVWPTIHRPFVCQECLPERKISESHLH